MEIVGNSRQSSKCWTIQDLVVLILFVYMSVANKNHGDNVSIQLFSWIQLMFVGYFILRVLFQFGGNIVHNLVLLLIETIACFESVWGILQILGLIKSNNSLFLCTGTFDNPGPLGGFLAVCFSISLAAILKMKQKDMVNTDSILDHVILGVSYTTVILCAIVLPSTQSRAAFLSILVATVFYIANTPKLRNWIKAYWFVTLLAVIVLLSVVLVFKRPSKKGRIITYKMELLTIKRNNYEGVGLGHFSSAYGKTQRDYFSKTISIKDGRLDYDETDKERQFADNPNVGFNDYLQMGIELGAGPLLLFLLLTILILFRLSRQRSAFFYGMVSMLVFAFFSYPFSLWENKLLFLLFAAYAGGIYKESYPTRTRSILFIISCIIPVFIFYKSVGGVINMNQNEKKWEQQRFVFGSDNFEAYEYCCSELYPELSNNYAFLYEYAYSLFENGKVDESEKILNESLELSSNPLLLILLGDIHKKQGLIDEAERDYFNAFLNLPDRLYPLYKMAVLYKDTNQTIRYKNMVSSIEKFQPRVESQSTKEIRDKLKLLEYIE